MFMAFSSRFVDVTWWAVCHEIDLSPATHTMGVTSVSRFFSLLTIRTSPIWAGRLAHAVRGVLTQKRNLVCLQPITTTNVYDSGRSN
jgi:hypothetical protein